MDVRQAQLDTELMELVTEVFSNPERRYWWGYDIQGEVAPEIERLLKLGANPYQQFSAREWNVTFSDFLFHVFVKLRGHPKRFNLLRRVAKYIDINKPNRLGQSPLLVITLCHEQRGRHFNHSDCDCLLNHDDTVKILLENGAYIPPTLVKSQPCSVLMQCLDNIRAAQSACFCFIGIWKFRYFPALNKMPKDVVKLICRDYIWSSRRDFGVWSRRRSRRLKKLKTK